MTMASCSISLFDEKIECSQTKRMFSFKVDDTNKEIQIDGVVYRFDGIDATMNMVRLLNENCKSIFLSFELFGQLHAFALSGIHEFNAFV